MQDNNQHNDNQQDRGKRKRKPFFFPPLQAPDTPFHNRIKVGIFVGLIVGLLFFSFEMQSAEASFDYGGLINNILKALSYSVSDIAHSVIIRIVIPIAFIFLVVMYVINVIQKSAREANLLLRDRLLRFFVILLICLPFYTHSETIGGGQVNVSESLLTLFPKVVVQSSFGFANEQIAKRLVDVIPTPSSFVHNTNFLNSCPCTVSGGSSSSSSSWFSTVINFFSGGGTIPGVIGTLIGGFIDQAITGGGGVTVDCSAYSSEPYYNQVKGTSYTKDVSTNICGGNNYVCKLLVKTAQLQSKYMEQIKEVGRRVFTCVYSTIAQMINKLGWIQIIILLLLIVILIILFFVVSMGLPAVMMFVSLASPLSFAAGLMLFVIAIIGAAAVGVGAVGVVGFVISLLILLIILVIPIIFLFMYQMTFFAYFIKWIIQAMVFIYMFIFSVIQLPFDRGKENYKSVIFTGITVIVSLCFLIITYVIGVVIFVNVLNSGLIGHAYQVVVTAGVITSDDQGLVYVLEQIVRTIIFVISVPAIFIWPVIKTMGLSFQAADMATGGRSFQLQ